MKIIGSLLTSLLIFNGTAMANLPSPGAPVAIKLNYGTVDNPIISDAGSFTCSLRIPGNFAENGAVYVDILGVLAFKELVGMNTAVKISTGEIINPLQYRLSRRLDVIHGLDTITLPQDNKTHTAILRGAIQTQGNGKLWLRNEPIYNTNNGPTVLAVCPPNLQQNVSRKLKNFLNNIVPFVRASCTITRKCPVLR